MGSPSRFCKGGDDVAISKAQQQAVARYNSKTYDRIEVKVYKGKKAEIQEYAQAHGESLNAFVNRAIAEAMERE